MKHDRCVVSGCINPVVRVYAHKACSDVAFAVCAFHGDSIIRHGSAAQLRDYLFPAVASGGKP